MCRLFAQHASPEHDHTEPLCEAPNALREQSLRHPHGWGIGWYDADGVQVRRGVMPAHADEAFCDAAREARSRIVLAHVRDASVGAVIEENTHPFVYGRWLFAHNGTVARFRQQDRVRARLEAEIHPVFRAAMAGETDSERCFFLFLTRLTGRLPAGCQADVERVRRALAEAVAIVSRIADGRSRPTGDRSSLNLLVTNGSLIAVCRHGRPLYIAAPGPGGSELAVASEPIGGRDWAELPEDHFAGIDAERRLLAGPLRQQGRLRRAG